MLPNLHLRHCDNGPPPSSLVRLEGVHYGEERWVSVGWLNRLVGVVVHTERQGEVIRVISARKATRREARLYVESIEN
ncbi:BrnT family toxin [Pseudomonas guariconensis]|nr:BrnT family toxin [Pseudomonas guariconensis]